MEHRHKEKDSASVLFKKLSTPQLQTLHDILHHTLIHQSKILLNKDTHILIIEKEHLQSTPESTLNN